MFAKVIIAGSVFLLSMGNAFAAPNLVLTNSFSPADGTRTYMDIGGTWNGIDETTPGDGFTLKIENTDTTDAAYDIRDIPVTVPAGFVLASSVSVADFGGGCPNMSASANQSGGAGGLVTINIASNNSTVINPGCRYEYTFRLRTNTATTAGVKSLVYDVSYNVTNNVNASVSTVSATQNINVNAGAILLAKTTLESNPLNNTLVDFNVEIQNTGTGGLFDVSLSDVLGDGLINLDINPPGSPSGTVISASEYQFDYIAAGQTVNVNVRARTDFPLSSSTCPTLENTASIDDRTSIVVPDSSASIPFELGALSIAHLNTSRCVLCGTGTVTLRLTNASGVDVNNLVITEDLLASELMIVNGTSRFNGALIAEPSRNLPASNAYTWTLPPGTTVPANSSRNLTFVVEYDTASFGINEDLARNNTTISASVDYELSCGVTQATVNSGNFLLTLNQPLPQVTKLARNVDAGQTAYAGAVYGHQDDDVIWRVQVGNNGVVNMQDFVLDDTITGNFDIKYVCNTESAASDAAVGSPPGANAGSSPGTPACVAYADVSTVLNFTINDPFGDVVGSDDISAAGPGEVFYVGKIKTSCGVTTNTVNVEWGCDVDGTLGGLASADIFAGGTVDTAAATLSTQGNGALSPGSITHTITGVDGGSEVGSRGIVTIRVENDTGGTIRGVVIDDLLPTEYVVDTTAPIDFVFEPAYGNGAVNFYGGVADEMTHNIDLDLADILNNTNLEFTITSNADAAVDPGDVGDNSRDFDLFRHGDVFTITFEIVLIDKVHFDKAADIDRTPEDATNTTTIAPIVPTDPDNTFTINNELTITYDDTCTFTGGQIYTENPQFTVDVEDLDVTMSSVIYVLTNAATVDLQVDVSNNGGHNAQDYFIYVAFGDAMTVTIPAPNCDLVTPSIPLPRPEWNVPDGIFSYQTVYVCSDALGMGTINAGTGRSLVFRVEKDAAAANDDLTFRADVIGEITLSDGTTLTDLDGAASTALDLDPITTSTSPAKSITPVANNYTHDAFRSRVIGFNLTKVRTSDLCSEDANVPVSGDTNIIIGEECNYDIKAGGWFGFDTPGFALIAVKDVTLRDDLPNGQGYIDHSTTIIGGTAPADEGVIFSPVPGDFAKIAPDVGAAASLDETDIDWLFNFEAESSPGITKKDKWFETTVRTRLLNDAVDDSAAGPNTHEANSQDTARASFIAEFDTVEIFVDENQAPPIPGFPVIAVRQVDMTATEPNIIITKQVCNETLAAAANPTVQNCIANDLFVDEVSDGDTNDSYIYRVTLTNDAGGSAVARAPAYNVISTDTLGSGFSDLMRIVDFENDGLDNDGDGIADGADAANEGALFDSIPDKAVGNGIPAVITVDENYNAKLLRVDPGAANTITFYYRVDPDDAIAPLQKLTNTVNMSYDSLYGEFGNQSDPQINNAGTPTIGRARIYTTADAIADVIMIPLEALPKAIITTSSTPLGGSPQNVVIGEEIRYQLTTQLPVANLRDFIIRDKLPPGIRCVENGPVVVMNSGGPHAAAGFSPDTSVTPVCNAAGDEIVWDFQDRALTMSPGITRFDFVIDFVARVENVDANRTGVDLTNGGVGAVGTDVTATYVNESGGTVVLEFDSVTVRVQEPEIALTKSFAVANSDAGDELVVTVTAENTGSAPAYNLQILDDLTLSDMTYINDSISAGAGAPDDDGVAADSKMPIFSWLPASSDYVIPTGVANIKTFTFRVRVDTTAQPLETLDNTIQAKWDSLRGQSTALNASGLIGADGSATGLRNGLIPNPTVPDTLNDYVTTASAFTEVLPLTLAKTIEPPAVVSTIGAHENFQIVITLPEGTTNDLVVTDALNASGLSYVLSRNASYDITYTFTDIVSINTVAPDEAAFRGATALPSTLPADADPDLLTWDIGTVVTAEEIDPGADAVNPSITINYYARVNNDLVTDDTDTLQNSATVTYDNGEDALVTESLNDTTAVQTVVEPLLEFLPAGAGVTVSNLTSPGVDPDGGDILEYQITLTNNGTSEAFDTNIVVTLPTQLEFDTALPVPTALINGAAVPSFEPTPAGGTTGPLIWGKDNADNTLDVPFGETLVLTYRTVVQTITEPNTALDITVTADWTSLEDNDPSLLFERTGNGCPTIAAPDDYCTTESDTINTIDDNSIVKSIIFDTYAVAPLEAFDSIVRIGDTVTYRLEVTIQEGTTDSVSVVDTLPAGMTFVDVISINGDIAADYDSPASGAGSNFSYTTIIAGNYPAVGATGALTWNFGTVSNDALGDSSTDTIVIEYRARVTEDAGIPHQDTTTLINTADLTYIDGNNLASPDPAATPRLRSTADLTVLQPIMDALSKLDRDGVPASGDPVNVATDTMNFRLHSCNTNGLAPAYGLMITDNLPTELNQTTITGPNNGALAPDVLINGVLATQGATNDYLYTPPAARGGNMLFVFKTPIDPGECVDIEFDIGFYTDFGFGSWSNIVTVDEYYSLPPADAQLYGPLAPVPFDMSNPATPSVLPEKTMIQPAPTLPEATIGDEIIYQIKVPETPFGAIMYDVNITDTLDNSLIYLSASDISTNGFTITDNTVLPITAGTAIDLVIDQIPAGQQAIIEVRARVDNNVDANAGVAFMNVTNYRYAMTDGATPLVNGGSDNTTSTLTIIEPEVTINKMVENITSPGLAPDAGDRLLYTIEMTASADLAPAIFYADAFDISIADSLSLGLLYNGNPTVDGIDIGNTIALPFMTGDGILTAQTLSWSLAEANADIDINVGETVTVTYEVLVLDTVQANQDLTNTGNVQWHSRDGPDVNQRDGSNSPALNDYFVNLPVTSITTPDNNSIIKTRVTDTFDATNNVRIGDIIEYRLQVTLQEGTHPSTVIEDSLPLGMMFEETVSINGDTTAAYAAANAVPAVPYTHTDIAAPAAAAGPTTITWTVGDIVNPGDNLANNNFEIIYRARVLNLALAPLPNTQPLLNSVDLTYDTATVSSTQNDTETVTVLQPNLSVTKIRIPVVPLDTVVDAGEVVTYRVDIDNTAGTAPAYDTVLRDIIPLGMRIAGVTTTNVQLIIGGVPQPALPNLVPVYDGTTGTTTWDFDTATADQYTIPAGEILRIEYQVQADAGIGAGLTLINEAQVQLYYSFDDGAVPSLGVAVTEREIYGPSNIAQVALDTLPASALLKTNPVDLDVSIGETFTYRITVPGVIQATALYDVRILDDLTASAADLQFVSVARVSGSQPWTPANVGTVADNLIIADAANGIDIPANEQVEIDITVTLRNTDPPNVAGLLFNNTATYTFNQIDNNATTQSNGLASTTADMTVVEADLTMDKRGPAGTVNFSVPIAYTLVVENIGSGPAFDTTLVDKLPDVPDNPPLTGGTCDSAPINFNARITTTLDETTVVRALALGTDYTATHTAAPTCELVITTLSDAARIESGEKLIVSYDVSLDPASQSGASLTNIAGVTQWFSLDTAGAGATGEIREYTRIITNGTIAPPVIDHEDAFTVIVDAPVLDVQKTVVNMTTGQVPGSDASPGDVLRYTIMVNNGGIIDAAGVTVSDVIPVNATYVADSVTLNGLPVAQPDAGVSPLIAGIDVSSSDLTPPLPGIGNGIITVGQTATVTFDVLLDPVINSGTIITNQALLDSPSTGVLPSDDPNINGTDDPVIIGDEDPTETLITSAPAFQVQKTSLDITGDPALLQAGDTLRYTLTVKNTGLENAVNALLSDQIPSNTTYAANSTTLNGVVVADPVAGISALAAGMLINAPENTTAGFVRADTNAAANNVAVITFDVVINSSAVIGTVISNQGFVNGEGAGSGVFPQQPSDDPDTAAVDDPTLDIVGNVPLFDVQKTVAIVVDGTTPGIVDPGDVLRYTITATNMGAIPITGVVLTDLLPANTTYVANSVLLNTLPIGQPDAGVLSLAAGIDISSSDLTPPLPLAAAGTVSPGQSAVVTFDVLVNMGTAAGTPISNQGLVSNNELPDELTDVDGIDSNGDQPTVVTVGSAPLISITKQVSVVGGGAALAGGQLEYTVRVVNTGIVPVTNVVITDDLLPVAGQMTYTTGSGLLNGLPSGVSFDIPGSTLTADYSSIYGNLAPAGIVELRFRVDLAPNLNIGDIVSNTGEVTWNNPPVTATASVDISIGGTPGAANLSGLVWHDTDFDNSKGASEVFLPDWRVELYQNNVLLGNAQTDANGVFGFSGLPSNLPAGIPYEVRYLAPGASATTASLGQTRSAFTDGPQRISEIFSASGSVIQNLNLPRQPNGIVYDSVQRVPVAGTRLTMINQTRSNQQLSTNCFEDPKHQNQVTLADGFYKFDLKFGDATCARGDEYEIQVRPPANGFVGTTSVIIPPVVAVTAAARDVPGCLGDGTDKVPATTLHCENSVSPIQPPDSVEPRTSGTDYNLKFLFNNVPVTSTDQIFNNHIAVDPKLESAVAISKIAGLQNVTRSQLVPYTITLNNTLSVRLSDLNVIDNFPAGFKYVTGSSRIDGVEVEPLINGRQLTWPNLSVEVNASRVIKLLLVVGSGVGEGEYVNTAQIINARTGEAFSGVASATVQVIPDPTFDCTDIIGKVYDDANNNAYQDQGEKGLPGVQVATSRGLRVTTDAHGRFHITCAVVPNEVRGSNFIMKLDDRTLPSGYRMTTENPRVQRATRGKMLKFNFGATIHRVVRLDLADGVFQKGSTELRPQWRSRIDMLITELEKDPSILRLSYLGENETESEVDDRLDAIEELISDRWQELDCCYKLTIETEVFWRKGNPSDRKGFE